MGILQALQGSNLNDAQRQGMGVPAPQPAPNNGGYLPFTDQLNNSMTDLNKLIGETQNSQAPQWAMQQSQDAARREAAARGIQGPLAASVTNHATNNLINQFGQWRTNALGSLMGQRSQFALQAQQAEEQRRQYDYARQSAIAQGQLNQRSQLINGLMSLLGGGLSFAGGGGFKGMFGQGGGAPSYGGPTNTPSNAAPWASGPSYADAWKQPY